jgi:hypothetical protein
MKLFIAISICLLVSGCFPIVENIYRPEASGGKLLETSCNYNQGPGRWDMIELSQEGVRMQVQAREINQQLKVSIKFLIPDGVTLQLVSTNFVLSDGNPQKAIELGDVEFYELERQLPVINKQQLTDPMIGKTYAGKWKPYDKEFWTSLSTPSQQVRNAFTLEMPQIRINEKPTVFPLIRFSPSKAAYLAGYCK